MAARRSSRTVLGSLLRSPNSQESVLDRLLEVSADEEHPERLLSELETAAETLKVSATSRSYRFGWTENYQRLFPDLHARGYKFELLEAFVNFYGQIYVNGEAYVFPCICHTNASIARHAFQQLKILLKKWASSTMLSKTPAVRTHLKDFDEAFANFESVYVHELIAIERKSRQPLASAIHLDRQLQKLEHASKKGSRCILDRDAPVMIEHDTLLSMSERRQRQCSEDGPCRQRESSGELNSETASLANEVQRLAASAVAGQRHEALEQLVKQVSFLNTCANPRGRGRGDLSIDVLRAAAEAFMGKSRRTSRREEAARKLLAWRVLAAFAELREYLVSADGHLQQIEPQLSNNAGLVAVLADWEEAWELGARFLLKPDLFSALCGLAAMAAEAQSFCPELQQLLEEQDADVFLILPRLVLISTLVNPGLAAMPASLLPEHFGAEEDDFQLPGSPELPVSAASQGQSGQLKDLLGLFEEVKTLGLSTDDAWKLLARCAVAGPGQDTSRELGQDVIDNFMRSLEALSMELQRKKPEEWNLCCSILMQCTVAASRVSA